MGRISLLTALLLAGALVSCSRNEQTIHFTTWDKVQVDERQVLPYTVVFSGQGMGWLVTKHIEIQGQPSRHQVINTLLSVLKESGERQGSGAFAPGSAPGRASATNAIKVTAYMRAGGEQTQIEAVGTAIWGPKGEFQEPSGDDEPYAIRIMMGPREAE